MRRKKIKRNILLNPGPATTTDSVKWAQIVPDICPREKEFGKLMESISRDLVKIAGGDDRYACVLFAGSGTAAMDAVINSVVPQGKKILILNNGAYGERMVKIARAYDLPHLELKLECDRLPDLKLIDEALGGPEIACLAMVHHETTTGLLNPIREIGQLAKKHKKVFIVDTISSFAGVPIDIKDCAIDFMMSTSNKCIQGMAGVCFVICKRDELEKTKHHPRRSFYLNLYAQYDYFQKEYQMQFTPPVQTLYAFRKAIDEFFEEGLEGRCKRYAQNWQVLRKGIQDLGLKILLNPEDESRLLITVLYPEGPNFDFDLMHDLLYERGFTIYPGKLDKKGTFRLANMGSIDPKDIGHFLDALRDVLFKMGVMVK